MDRKMLRPFLVTALVGWIFAPAYAAEPAAATTANIRHWIGQLGSDDYGTREEASVRLGRAGRSAVGP